LADFTNYYDYTICVNGVALNNIDEVGNPYNANDFLNSLFGFDSNTPQSTKIFFATAIIIVIFLFVLLGIWSMTGSGTLASLLSSVFAVIMFIIFAILGFYPAWIVVIIFIITAAIVVVFARKMVVGD
jgi:uncharacterized membrane protein